MSDQLKCSFCGKPDAEVHSLIAGPEGVYICDRCVFECVQIVNERVEPSQRLVKERVQHEIQS